MGIIAKSRKPAGAGRSLSGSMMRHCFFYKAVNGKWYMELAGREHGRQDEAVTYGPFRSFDDAEEFLDNFSNPGGWHEDDSGTHPVPSRSPNGDPVQNPDRFRRNWYSGRYGGVVADSDSECAMNKTMVASELVSIARDLTAIDFPNQEAYDKYLRKHPNADKGYHRILEKRQPGKPQSHWKRYSPSDDEVTLMAAEREAGADIGRLIGPQYRKVQSLSSGDWLVFECLHQPRRDPKRIQREIEGRLDDEGVDFRSVEVKTDGRLKHRLSFETYVIIEAPTGQRFTGGAGTSKTMVARELVSIARDLMAIDFPTQDAFDKYMKEHPDADRKNHKVVKNDHQDKPQESKGHWSSGNTSDADIPGLMSQLTKDMSVGFGIDTNKAKESLKAGLTEGDVIDFGAGNKAVIGKGVVTFQKGTQKIKEMKWEELEEKHKTALMLKKALNDSWVGTHAGRI